MAKPTIPNPDLITGNDAVVKINGLVAGFIKSIRVNINNNARPIKVLGRRKPRGVKSLDWDGTASGEFHILASEQEGVIKMLTADDAHADDLYQILVIHKTTGKRIGMLIGAVNTEGFSLMNNDFSGREVEFTLVDWQPMEAFN